MMKLGNKKLAILLTAFLGAASIENSEAQRYVRDTAVTDKRKNAALLPVSFKSHVVGEGILNGTSLDYAPDHGTDISETLFIGQDNSGRFRYFSGAGNWHQFGGSYLLDSHNQTRYNRNGNALFTPSRFFFSMRELKDPKEIEIFLKRESQKAQDIIDFYTKLVNSASARDEASGQGRVLGGLAASGEFQANQTYGPLENLYSIRIHGEMRGIRPLDSHVDGSDIPDPLRGGFYLVAEGIKEPLQSPAIAAGIARNQLEVYKKLLEDLGAKRTPAPAP
jgi:hypothetical protein